MDQARKNEIIAVILFALSLFLFLSIFTFTEQDLGFYTSTPNIVSKNVTGVVGAYIGGFLLFFIGKAAYVMPLLILVWGASRLLQIEARKIFFKFFGTLFLVTAVSASLSMIDDLPRTAAFKQGGLIGTLVSGFLIEYLGRIGAIVFISAMIILSMLIATEFLILPVTTYLFKLVLQVLVNIKSGAVGRLRSAEERARTARERKLAAIREETAKKLELMRKQADEAREKSPLQRQQEELVKPKPAVASEPKITAKAPLRKPQKATAKPVRVAPVSDTATGEEIKYNLPSLDLLKKPVSGNIKERKEALKDKAALLERTLQDFGVQAKVVEINKGPVITMYELEPAIGTKINKITSLSDNISLALKSTSSIRIVAPLPGKGTVGIEVPNAKSELVLLRDIIETEDYSEEGSPLKLALGKDIAGAPIITDLTKMPHLLVAGATGSGKTVCLNCIISSLLYNCSPEELKFMMIDPKRVELMMFEGIPHLVSPIVTNPKKAASALNWVVNEMERRYQIFAEKGVRNITLYKERLEEEKAKGAGGEVLPYIIVIVDELADLMMVAQQDVEGTIMRLAQLSRAAGIHLILATQRPSVNVITGVIKANIPARISFKVTSKVDSRTVLDANGAEKLLGMGDMLLMEPGEVALTRGQCSLVTDSEIRNIVKYIKSQAGPQYIEEAVERQTQKASETNLEKDELYEEAVKLVIQTKQASVSMIQRKLRVGYTRAARMIDIMEEEGVVGAYNGSKPREILVDDYDAVRE